MQYRQITYRLRVQRGVGRPDLISVRPTKTGRKSLPYLDSEDNPTLVEFDEYCQVDIPSLLAIGAIAEWYPPRARASSKPEVSDGKASS